MKSENLKFINIGNNIIKTNSSSHKKKLLTRNKVFWSEREEKTLFILQMALGTKFSIIKTFLKDKSVNDIKNHFYSKLRTYLSIQISKLQSENYFKDIDKNYYTIKKVLSLVLSNKIPTMILNKNVIKELILENEQEKKRKKSNNKNREENANLTTNIKEEKKEENKLKKKRGRGRPKGGKKEEKENLGNTLQIGILDKNNKKNIEKEILYNIEENNFSNIKDVINEFNEKEYETENNNELTIELKENDE